MNIFEKNKRTILGLLLLGVVFGGYYLFGRPATLPGIEATSNVAGLGDEELLTELSKLKSLELDDSIFSDPVFRSLTDFSQPITPEPVGRENPFLPIGAMGTTTGR